MQEWICDYLEEMIEKLGIEINDDISDVIVEYSQGISDGVREGYYLSSNYVADCNLKESVKSREKSEIESLKSELDALYNAIRIKGFNFHYKNNQVYETGEEYVGGSISASYDRPVKIRF